MLVPGAGQLYVGARRRGLLLLGLSAVALLSVVVLVGFFADLTYEEIAEITGVRLNSVRSQLFEARQRLKPVLDEYFSGADV